MPVRVLLFSLNFKSRPQRWVLRGGYAARLDAAIIIVEYVYDWGKGSNPVRSTHY